MWAIPATLGSDLGERLPPCLGVAVRVELVVVDSSYQPIHQTLAVGLPQVPNGISRQAGRRERTRVSRKNKSSKSSSCVRSNDTGRGKIGLVQHSLVGQKQRKNNPSPEEAATDLDTNRTGEKYVEAQSRHQVTRPTFWPFRQGRSFTDHVAISAMVDSSHARKHTNL